MSGSHIYDKLGNTYDLHTIVDGPTLLYEVYEDSIQAGQLLSQRKSADEIYLVQVEIKQIKEAKTSFWKKPVSKFKNRGLGTSLLMHFIEDVYQKGYKKITAQVTRIDMRTQPYLIPWYKKHGFKVDLVTNPEGNVGAFLNYTLKSEEEV